jgi:hypothetical protein
MAMVPILSQVNPIHTVNLYIPKILIYITLPSTTMSSKLSLFPSAFPGKIV